MVSVFSLLLENHMNYQSIFLPYLSEYAIPSDMGTLLLRGIVSNSVASVRGNSTSDRTDLRDDNSPISFNVDLDLRYYTYTTNFLEAYNPVMNHWHGAHESRSVQGRILFNGTLLSAETESALLLGEEQRGTDYISAVMHSHTATYILGKCIFETYIVWQINICKMVFQVKMQRPS